MSLDFIANWIWIVAAGLCFKFSSATTIVRWWLPFDHATYTNVEWIFTSESNNKKREIMHLASQKKKKKNNRKKWKKRETANYAAA